MVRGLFGGGSPGGRKSEGLGLSRNDLVAMFVVEIWWWVRRRFATEGERRRGISGLLLERKKMRVSFFWWFSGEVQGKKTGRERREKVQRGGYGVFREAALVNNEGEGGEVLRGLGDFPADKWERRRRLKVRRKLWRVCGTAVVRLFSGQTLPETMVEVDEKREEMEKKGC
ncbi:hypothetical protein HAX54_015445 [Datura stramonium]|uniref:Uncharacterized protein n=1 Tax=Datura stramonium TaxID=4076 RepID=A0ABS8Y580_DATST|nr:hypothetical protein [Datura stramonium]